MGDQRLVAAKLCPKCRTAKPLSEFWRDRSAANGRQSYCILCRRGYYTPESRARQAAHRRSETGQATQRRYVERMTREHPNRRWAITTRHSHQNAGHTLAADITIDWLEALADDAKLCPICGLEMAKNDASPRSGACPTLDRINNETHLRRDNLWIICRVCNTSKGNRTLAAFLDYCRVVTARDESREIPQ